MNKLLASLLLLSASASGMERLSGWCEQGAKVVVAPSVPGGTPLTRNFQQSYPICTVTVFITGTVTKATIYSSNNPSPVALSNPFQATTLGYWDFYANNGHYDVQISGGGLPAPFTFGDMDLFDIVDFSPCPGCYLSATGFISTAGKFDDYTSATGGFYLRAGNVSENTAHNGGGYIKLSPITYNPNNGPPVFDTYGNPVRDPVYLAGDSLSTHDAVLFVAEATDLVPNPDLIFGIFTNQYMFSRVGFATDYASEASFQSLNGGMQALSFAAVNYMNTGQHNGTPPPLTNLDSFHPGAIFYDTLAGCEKLYSGSAWSCIGSGGGGGGTPGGPTTSVQFNNSGIFGGVGNFTWNSGTNLLNVNTADALHAGMNVHNGFIQADAGFVVGVGTTYNSVNTPMGGVAAQSLTASRYVQTGASSSVPTPSTGDTFHPGALYYDTANSCESVFNGSGWNCLASGGSTSPGPPINSVQYNVGGAFTGNGKFTWDTGQFLNIIAASTSSPGINVQLGFIQSATGFVAAPGSANTFNAVSAISGGMTANSFTGISYLQTGHSSGVPSPTSGDTFHQGSLYWDDSSGGLRVFNGLAWNSLSSGGTAVGPDTAIQFAHPGGVFNGSANMTFDPTLQLLSVNASSSATAGINVHTGFIQSDVGFVAALGNTFNSVQSLFGGMKGRNFTATNYIQTGFGANDPGSLLNALTSGDNLHPGAMYWNTVAGQELVYNGVAFVALGGGGGSPGGVNGSVQFNNGGVFAGSASFTWNVGSSVLTVPGAVTGNAANFTSVTSIGLLGAGVIQSGATGSNIAFQTTNFNIQIDGAGNIGTVGRISVGGTTVIAADRSAAFTAVTSAGFVAGQGQFISFATGANIAFSTLTSAFVLQGDGTIKNGSTTLIDNTGTFYGNGTAGVTSTTCSQFRKGICVAP